MALSTTPSYPALELPALQLAGRRRHSRRFGRLLLLVLLLLPFVLAFAPWQQNLPGEGRVIEFDPVDRPMPIQARTDGVILRWHVREGQLVQAGDPIVDLADNDARILERLQEQLVAGEQKRDAARSKRDQYTLQIEEAEQARRAAMQLALDEIAAAEQAVVVAEQAVAVAGENVKFRAIAATMWQGLVTDRIGAGIEFESAKQQLAIARADAIAWMAACPRERFDLVLLDPPFDSSLQAPALGAAVPLLAPGGWLYLESPAPLQPEDCPEALAPTRQGRAGAVHYHLLQRNS